MSDFIPNKISFDVAGYKSEFNQCLNIALDQLSGNMHDVLCRVISQCSEAANVMIMEAQKNVREISREISNGQATIKVGVDEGSIAGGEQGYVRVMVSLYGNHEVWARVGGVAWTKHVNSKRKNQVQTEYRLPFFEQGDHSETMMLAFDRDIEKHVRDFFDTLDGLLASIDYSKYIIGG